MSEIEPFARVWLSELQSGTRVVVGGVSIEGAGQNEADKINAAFESAISERVKKAVEEFRERAVGAALRDEIDDGGLAFPVSQDTAHFPGMTLRQWYAGMALQGYLSNPTSFGPPVPESDKYNPRLVADVSANFAYMLADAMIRAGKGEK